MPYERYDRERDRRERGFFDRAGDEVRSWFGDEEAERRRRTDEQYDTRADHGRYEPGGYRAGGDRDPGADYRRSNRDEGYGDRYAGYRTDPGHGAGTRGYDERGQRASGYRGAGGYRDASGYRDAAGDRDERAGGGEWRDRYAERYAEDRDAGYRSWRDQQIASFDRDYDEYRRENQSRFDSEFATWRQGRQAKRDLLGQVREHQEVVGSDGASVGTVDHVRSDHVLLTRSDPQAGGHHHAVPAAWIASVADQVTLDRTAEQARAGWRDAEGRSPFGGDRDRDRDGDRDGGGQRRGNLGRSFSGTY